MLKVVTLVSDVRRWVLEKVSSFIGLIQEWQMGNMESFSGDESDIVHENKCVLSSV